MEVSMKNELLLTVRSNQTTKDTYWSRFPQTIGFCSVWSYRELKSGFHQSSELYYRQLEIAGRVCFWAKERIAWIITVFIATLRCVVNVVHVAEKRGAHKLPMCLHNFICKKSNFRNKDSFQNMVIRFGGTSPKWNGESIKLRIYSDGRIVGVCVCVLVTRPRISGPNRA